MRKKLHLIPGTMCNEKLWVKVLPYSHESLEVIYLDIPHGKNFEELAEHYNKVFSNDTVNLIGFSLGGYIATYFSMLYPQQVGKLFVISNSPTTLPSEEIKQRCDILKHVEKYGYRGMSRKNIAKLLDEANQTDYLINFILEMSSELGEREFVSQNQYTSKRSDLLQAITQFPFEMHLYYSEHDRLIDSQWLNDLTNSNPRLSVISTSGSGHMLPLEKPRELANYINSWAEL